MAGSLPNNLIYENQASDKKLVWYYNLVVSLGAWFTFPVFHNISILSLKALIIIIRCYFNTSNAIKQLFMWLKQCDRIVKKHVSSPANSFSAS